MSIMLRFLNYSKQKTGSLSRHPVHDIYTIYIIIFINKV